MPLNANTRLLMVRPRLTDVMRSPKPRSAAMGPKKIPAVLTTTPRLEAIRPHMAISTIRYLPRVIFSVVIGMPFQL